MKYCIPKLILIAFLFTRPGSAQIYTIRGMVFDSSRNYPMEAVSVISTSGNTASSNAEGFYKIEVGEKDSIWFSYLEKATVKFPVLSRSATRQNLIFLFR